MPVMAAVLVCSVLFAFSLSTLLELRSRACYLRRAVPSGQGARALMTGPLLR
mgnify:CR=1 FL=1